MKTQVLIILLAVAVLGKVYGQVKPNHQNFSQLLQKYVDNQGMVDYKGFINDRIILERYLDELSKYAPQDNWSQEEKLAYWINAYNAFTIKLIIDNYPLQSITDLHPLVYIPGFNTVWHKEFFQIGGEDMSLDHIEHEILRKEFNEPRIHFAINCASFSCPPLRNEAFIAERLGAQLDEQTITFINDRRRNDITKSEAEISKIFSWFTKDFTKQGTLIQYLNKYSRIRISKDADIDYMDYDWSLNESK